MNKPLKDNKIALGAGLGVTFGIIFGAVIDNVGLGIALGAALGSTMQKEDHSNNKLNYNFLMTLYLHGFLYSKSF